MRGLYIPFLAVVAAVAAMLPSAAAAPRAEGLGLAQVACIAQSSPWDDEEGSADGSAKNCPRGKALLDASDVVVSADGRNVYVAAYGANSLVSYVRSGPLGQLRQIGCVTSNGTSGVDGTKRACTDGDVLSGAENIALSPDGKNLYVASSASSGIAVFRRDPATGKVTQSGCVKGIATCTGARGLSGAADVVVSPDGRNLYLAAYAADAITMFARDAATGALKGLGCISDDGTDRQCASGNALRGADALAITRDGRWLYVSAADSNSVLTFERDPATGALTQRGCAMYRAPVPGSCARVNGLSGPGALVLAPDERTLFVTAYDSGGIAVFARDRSTGAITERGCLTDTTYSEQSKDGCAHTAPLSSPSGLTLSPDGRRLYLATSAGMTVLERDASTGGLVKVGCVISRGYVDYLPKAMKACMVAEGVSGAAEVAVTPDGRNVYLAAGWSNALSVFAPAASVAVTRSLSARGTVAVRVSCPSTLAGGCGGHLTLAGTSGRRVAPSRPYALRPGAVKRLVLRFDRRLKPKTLVLRALDRRSGLAAVEERIEVVPTPAGLARPGR